VTGWEELVAAALLGTDRRPPGVDSLPGAVRERLDADADPARLLLDAAALSATYRRAGRPALRDLEPLPAAPADHRPAPRTGASRGLAGMLEGRHRTVLPEWLAVLTDRGWRAPPEHLPALADLARTRPELRELVSRAAGPRAAWLAAANPDWSFLAEHEHEPVDQPDDEVWLHGTPPQRRRWLTGTRRRDPDAAREALAASWPTESATDRADLLTLLAQGLSAADEEFLEAVLDDRARAVRFAAASLLQRLPGSAYQHRMTERVRGCLTVREHVLEVSLPPAFDESMRRDCLDPNPPRGTGERAWWLRQLVEAAPLASYELGPELLDLRVDGYDAGQLRAALATAVVREGSARWALALLEHGPLPVERIAKLVAVLPPADQAAAVAGLRKAGVRTAEQFTLVVSALPAPWPADLATAILDLLSQATIDDTWSKLASAAARATPYEVLTHPITGKPPGEEYTWHRRLIETLTFRRAMYEEL